MLIDLTAILLIFLIITAFVWIIFFSFKPKIFRFSVNNGKYDPSLADPAKCFVGAILAALLVIFILWMFKVCDIYQSTTSIGSIILNFLIITSVIWIILFTFSPKIVKYVDKNTQNIEDVGSDPIRCFVGSLISSFSIVVILWMFKICK